MKLLIDQDLVLRALVALIARSPIVVARPESAPARLPAGYDDADMAILDWIAAEGRRAGRRLVRM